MVHLLADSDVVLSCLGVQSFAGSGFGLADGCAQNSDSLCKVRNPTKRQDRETSPGSLVTAPLHQHFCLN